MVSSISRYPFIFSRLLAVVLVLACTAPAAVSQQLNGHHPPFTLPAAGFRFGFISYTLEPYSNETLGALTETSDGLAFLDPTLEPFKWGWGDASVDLVFRLRNTKGIRSITYEFSGGYSFDEFGPRSVSTGATIMLRRYAQKV